MGMMDAFTPDTKVELKFSDFYNLVKGTTRAEMMLNGIKNEVDHDLIYKIVTGNPLHENAITKKEDNKND